MELVIENKEKEDLDRFMIYLLDFTKNFLYETIERDRLKQREKRFNKLLENRIKTKIHLESLLVAAIQNLQWRKSSGKAYKIVLNRNEIFFGTDITISSLMRLLEYGTVNFPPLNFFHKKFKEIAESLPEIYESWKKSIGEDE